MLAFRCLLLGLCALPLAAASNASTALAACVCEGDLLDCSSRERTSLSSEDLCDGATKLNLFNNHLGEYPDGLQGRFLEVDVSSNRLTALPRRTQLHPRTAELNLAGNAIGSATEQLRDLAELQTLDVSANRLQTLSFLPSPCALREFEASENQIGDLHGPLKDCKELQLLSLSDNNLQIISSGVFAKLARLLELDLSENKLTELATGGFKGLQRLEYLDLRKNRLRVLVDGVFLGLDNLKTLHLSSNPLRSISGQTFLGTRALEHLHLNDAALETLPGSAFHDVTQLKTLYLSGNKLTRLHNGQFKTSKRLEEIHLQGNRLSELPGGAFSGAQHLRALHLERNRLSDVPRELLHALDRLETLDLDGNRLRRLPGAALRGLRSLRTLSLRYNNLTALPVLEDCCERLRLASFRHNALAGVDEAAVRAMLRRGADVDVRNNRLQPASLRWAVAAGDLRAEVDARACACGEVRGGGASVYLCADVACGASGDVYGTWVDAARAAESR